MRVEFLEIDKDKVTEDFAKIQSAILKFSPTEVGSKRVFIPKKVGDV